MLSKCHTNVLESRKIKQRKVSQKFINLTSVCKQTNLNPLFHQGMLRASWDSRKDCVFFLEVDLERNLFTKVVYDIFTKIDGINNTNGPY